MIPEAERNLLFERFGVDEDGAIADPAMAFFAQMDLLYRAEVEGGTDGFLLARTFTTKRRRGAHGAIENIERRSYSEPASEADYEAAVDALLDHFEKHPVAGWYVPLGLQNKAVESEFKGATKDSSVSPRVLFLDVDMAGAGHASTNLPNVEQTLDALVWFERILGVHFTGISFTGGGVHALLALDGPLSTEGGRLWTQLQRSYADYADFHLDALGGAGGWQTMRVVGSCHQTHGNRVVWLRIDESTPHVSIEDIEARMADAIRALGHRPVTDPEPEPEVEVFEPTQKRLTGTGASTGRKGNRPGDRLSAAVSPLETLRALCGITEAKSTGRWTYPNGGPASDGNHIEVRPTDSAVRVWSQRMALDLGIRTGLWYQESFTLLTEIYGDAYVVRDAIVATENAGKTIPETLLLLKANPSSASLRKLIGKPRRTRSAKSRG